MALIKGIEFEFADGSKLVLSPLSLGALEVLSPKLEAGLKGFEFVKLVIDVVTASLKRNYKDITREKVANDLVDMSNMQEVFDIVIQKSLLKKEGSELGEQQAG